MGPAPFGEREGEAAIVEKIQAMDGEGATLRAIAKALNDDSIPTRAGAPWAAGTVAKILRRAGKEPTRGDDAPR
jgi:hypothetical protein